MELDNFTPGAFEEHSCTTLHPQSVEEIMATPLDTPLSRKENRLATTLVKRKLAERGGKDGILQFRTGGQVSQIIHYNKMKLIITALAPHLGQVQ